MGYLIINKNTKYEGKVIEVIGHKHDPGVDILSIIYKYDINVDFPEPVGPTIPIVSPLLIENEMFFITSK